MSEIKKLRQENWQLRSIIEDTLWMAVRYADGRYSYAPTTVNTSMDLAILLGVSLRPDITLKDKRGYAMDGEFGYWNPEIGRFTKEEPNE